MREIKFRIWHKPTKRFTRHRIEKFSKKPKYVKDFIQIDSEYYVINKHEELFLNRDGYPVFMYWELEDSCYMEGFYPDEYIVQQWTQLTDDNGKDIYEGDLVIQYYDEDTVYEVKWIKAYSGYQWCLVDTKSKYRDEPSDYYGGLGSCLKVVGNIFNGVESKSC